MKYYDIIVDETKWKLDTSYTSEKSLQLFITNRCNLNCKNCFASNLTAQQKIDMQYDDIIKLSKNNPEYARVNLMGGEPLFHKDINKIIKGLKDVGNQKITIYTNGLMLKALNRDIEPVRFVVSFYELNSNDKSRKPLIPLLNELENLHKRNNKIVLNFLIDKYNYLKVNEIIDYIDKNVKWIETLRIGLMRNEECYFNDEADGVISFEMYSKIIQELLNTYQGRLSFEILTKGILIFNKHIPNEYSVDRFRNVYPDMRYSDCVMGTCGKEFKTLGPDKKLPPTHTRCMITNQKHCLIYRVCLYRIKK